MKGLDKKISSYRKSELKFFCLQYEEWKMRINKCVNISEKEKLVNKCKMVEQAAIQADSSIYTYIIKNVTQKIPYECLGAPCCRQYFYEKRGEFFRILNKLHNS